MTDLEKLNQRIDELEKVNKRMARVHADFLTNLVGEIEHLIQLQTTLRNRITAWIKRNDSP